jgi:hypothetical protein
MERWRSAGLVLEGDTEYRRLLVRIAAGLRERDARGPGDPRTDELSPLRSDERATDGENHHDHPEGATGR